MEESLVSAPVLLYGALFLDETTHDGFLDLVFWLCRSSHSGSRPVLPKGC